MRRPSPKRPHPADLHAARLIRRAVKFTAFLRLGPFEVVREDDLPTASAALAAAERLTREHGRSGRRACAYAVTPDNMTVHLTPDLISLSQRATL